MAKISDIERVGLKILRLARAYRKHIAENNANLLFFGFLSAWSTRPVDRERHIRISGLTKRFDFRIGGSNPVHIEFAWRTRVNGGELYGSQNRSELRKLTRLRSSQTKLRVLLLLDASDRPIPQNDLKATYDSQNSGKGRFKRHPVRVIYCHERSQYSFSWKPL